MLAYTVYWIQFYIRGMSYSEYRAYAREKHDIEKEDVLLAIYAAPFWIFAALNLFVAFWYFRASMH